MDTSMHGDLPPVEVLFPDFEFPETALSHENWATLVLKLHAQLNGFPTSTGRGQGSIPWLLETEGSHQDGQYSQGGRKIIPENIDDSRCATSTRGVFFARVLSFGNFPRALEWQGLKKDKPLPKARRTVHLYVAKSGFFIVTVRWVPKARWSGNFLGEYFFENESVVVVEAGEEELASFFKNMKKNSPSIDYPIGSVVATRIVEMQEQVTSAKLYEYQLSFRRHCRMAEVLRPLH